VSLQEGILHFSSILDSDISIS